MAAGTYNIILEQGATFSKRIRWEDSNGTPIDLTGYSGAAQIRRSVGDASPVATFTVTIVSPETGGEIDLTLSAATTGAIAAPSSRQSPKPLVKYIWDLELTSGTGTVTRLLEGSVTFSPQVTQ